MTKIIDISGKGVRTIILLVILITLFIILPQEYQRAILTLITIMLPVFLISCLLIFLIYIFITKFITKTKIDYKQKLKESAKIFIISVIIWFIFTIIFAIMVYLIFSPGGEKSYAGLAYLILYFISSILVVTIFFTLSILKTPKTTRHYLKLFGITAIMLPIILIILTYLSMIIQIIIY